MSNLLLDSDELCLMEQVAFSPPAAPVPPAAVPTPPAASSISLLARSWSGPRLRKPRSSFTSPLSESIMSSTSSSSTTATTTNTLIDLSFLVSLPNDGIVELLDALLANSSLEVLRQRVISAIASARLNSQRGFDLICVRNERLLRCLELVASNPVYASLVPVLLNELPVPTLCGATMVPPADSGVYLAGTAGSVAYDASGRRLLLAAGEPFGIVLLCSAARITRVCVSWRASNGIDFWKREHTGNSDRDAIVACFDAHRPAIDEQHAASARVVALEAPTLAAIDMSQVGVLLVFIEDEDNRNDHHHHGEQGEQGANGAAQQVRERICCTVTVDVWRGSTSQQSALNRIVPHF